MTPSKLPPLWTLVAVAAGGTLGAALARIANVDFWVVCGLGVFVGWLAAWYAPREIARRDVRRLERQLGALLPVLSVLLEFQPFEMAVRSAVRMGNSRPHPALRLLASELEHHDAGAALRRLSERSDSVRIRKAALQLALVYREGGAASLQGIGEEFAQERVQQLRAFSARVGFLSVLFVVLAALLPLLFCAFVLVGSRFLSFTFTPALVLAVLVAGIPLAVGALVAWAALSAPED